MIRQVYDLITFVSLLSWKMMFTALDLAVNFLFHVRGQDVSVEVRILKVRVAAIFAVKLFQSTVNAFVVCFKIVQHVKLLVAQFTSELW